MRKLLLILLVLTTTLPSFAQEVKSKKAYTLPKRAADHFMVQFAINSWLGEPDSINRYINGFQKSANVYVMLDKPFKSDPRFSLAGGLGVGTSNMYFRKMYVDIGSQTLKLPFIAQDNTNYYKKFKVSTTYLDLPIEFRFASNPSNMNKGIKAAIGLKAGLLVNAHNKAKTLRNASGAVIHNITLKETTPSFFSPSRFDVTSRVGYGNFTLFCNYGFTSLFKNGVAPDINVLQFGLTFSGL